MSSEDIDNLSSAIERLGRTSTPNDRVLEQIHNFSQKYAMFCSLPYPENDFLNMSIGIMENAVAVIPSDLATEIKNTHHYYIQYHATPYEYLRHRTSAWIYGYAQFMTTLQSIAGNQTPISDAEQSLILSALYTGNDGLMEKILARTTPTTYCAEIPPTRGAELDYMGCNVSFGSSKNFMCLALMYGYHDMMKTLAEYNSRFQRTGASMISALLMDLPFVASVLAMTAGCPSAHAIADGQKKAWQHLMKYYSDDLRYFFDLSGDYCPMHLLLAHKLTWIVDSLFGIGCRRRHIKISDGSTEFSIADSIEDINFLATLGCNTTVVNNKYTHLTDISNGLFDVVGRPVKFMRILLANGADPNTHDGFNDQNTIIKYVSHRNQEHFIMLLIAFGADMPAELSDTFDSWECEFASVADELHQCLTEILDVIPIDHVGSMQVRSKFIDMILSNQWIEAHQQLYALAHCQTDANTFQILSALCSKMAALATESPSSFG